MNKNTELLIFPVKELKYLFSPLMEEDSLLTYDLQVNDSLLFISIGELSYMNVFGGTHTDSVTLIFNNERIVNLQCKSRTGEGCLEERNFLDMDQYEDIGLNTLRYVITEEDYQNATKLGG